LTILFNVRKPAKTFFTTNLFVAMIKELYHYTKGRRVMTKQIFIRLKDGEKESELKMDAFASEHQLAVIDGLFKFFDVHVDFKELADVYMRSGEAYKSFFEKMDSDVPYNNEQSKEKRVGTAKITKVDAEQYENALKETETATETNSAIFGYHSSYDPLNNDYYVTGIKYDSTGKPQYKCRYKCPACHNESNHYIRPGIPQVKCWECNRLLKVKPSTIHGEPDKSKSPELYRDQKGNFFIAGAFEPDVKTLADVTDTE
jgi:hypothetical protein